MHNYVIPDYYSSRTVELSDFNGNEDYLNFVKNNHGLYRYIDGENLVYYYRSDEEKVNFIKSAVRANPETFTDGSFSKLFSYITLFNRILLLTPIRYANKGLSSLAETSYFSSFILSNESGVYFVEDRNRDEDIKNKVIRTSKNPRDISLTLLLKELIWLMYSDEGPKFGLDSTFLKLIEDVCSLNEKFAINDPVKTIYSLFSHIDKSMRISKHDVHSYFKMQFGRFFINDYIESFLADGSFTPKNIDAIARKLFPYRSSTITDYSKRDITNSLYEFIHDYYSYNKVALLNGDKKALSFVDLFIKVLNDRLSNFSTLGFANQDEFLELQKYLRDNGLMNDFFECLNRFFTLYHDMEGFYDSSLLFEEWKTVIENKEQFFSLPFGIFKDLHLPNLGKFLIPESELKELREELVGSTSVSS